MRTLTFDEYDKSTFPLLDFACKCFFKGGVIPSVLNGANEEAVALFLDRRIGFADITRLVEHTVRNYKDVPQPCLEDILRAGEDARRIVRESI